jgi:hypothetical protein
MQKKAAEVEALIGTTVIRISPKLLKRKNRYIV